jgi:hypothetical protein
MTITAVNPEPADVMLVAERQWLDRRVNIGARVIIRTRESHHHNETPAYRGKASDQKETKPRIGAGREDLSHPSPVLRSPELETLAWKYGSRFRNHSNTMEFA